MLIVAIDESTKKARVRSRRVLGRYLFQYGAGTYAAHLSKEGAEELLKELKAQASKATAVGLFTSSDAHGLQLWATAGRASTFSSEGWFAHREARRHHPETAPRLTNSQKLLRLLVRMAALFHDLGKASVQFQKKLRGLTDGAERIRHELLSYLMLQAWRGTLQGSDWLEKLEESAVSMSNCASSSGRVQVPELLAEQLSLENPSERSAAWETLASQVLAHCKDDPLWGAVCWLVLTHHKLVNSNADTHQRATVERAQLNPQVPFDAENLALVPDLLPWNDGAWLEQVSACAKGLRRLLSDNPGLLDRLTRNPEQWANLLAGVCRPYLVYSDYIGSLQKQASKPASRDSHSEAFANTAGEQGHLADTLPEHLKKVRRAVDKLFSLTEPGKSAAFPALTESDVGARSLLRTGAPDKESPFRWQFDAAEAIRQHDPERGKKPCFIVLASGTGAGKTAGGVRVLQAASEGELRLTVGLGLRSLTLQTGAAYVDPDGLALPRSEVMTVVGDALYAELNAPSKMTAAESEGSESLEESALLVDGADQYAKGGPLSHALGLTSSEMESLLSSRKSVALTQVPVLVCTVDHLMKAAAPMSGTDARMTLRIASSDLILDEVDNYSAEDLVSVGRLVYLAGLHGRRVVVMSATVSETTLKALYLAWHEGFAAYCLRKEAPREHFVALISDKTEPQVLKNPTPEQAAVAVSVFVENLVAKTPPPLQKNRAEVLPLGNTLAAAWSTLFQASMDLAERHHTVMPSGAYLSTGVVRFNNVRSAREFAQFLHSQELPDGLSLRVVCYHRRTPLYLLTLLERSLNGLLNRKKPEAIFEQELVRQWQAEEPSAQRYLLIVCATSIQETGRDHDYDFAIAEPWSTRSFVQLAGRVRRHRSGRAASANVLLMDKALNELRPGSSNSVELQNATSQGPLKTLPVLIRRPEELKAQLRPPVARGIRPGVESDISKALKAVGAYELPAGSTPLTGAYSMPIADWTEGIVAHGCLKAPLLSKAPLTALEHAMQCARMFGPGPWPLKQVVSDEKAPLFAGHHKAVLFRRQTAQQLQLTFRMEHGLDRLALVRQDRAGLVLEEACYRRTPLDNPQRALIRLDKADPWKDERVPERAKTSPKSIDAKLLFSFEAYGDESTVLARKPIVDFHPLLGADSVRLPEDEWGT